MQLISIEKRDTTDKVVVNKDHICSIYDREGTIIISLANGDTVLTKFSDVEHAVDYMNRSSYVAYTHDWTATRDVF